MCVCVWRSLYGYVAIVVSFCSWRRLSERGLLLLLLLLLLPLMALCCVYTTQTSRVIYDELALVRFTRSVRPSVRPSTARSWTSLTTRRAGLSMGAGQSARPAARPSVGGWVSAMPASVAITLAAANLLRAASK